MIRKCPHCRKKYDTAKGESSVWCERNKRRGRGAGRLPSRLVTIAALVVPPSPFR